MRRLFYMALKVLKWVFFCRCRVNGEKRIFSVFTHTVLLAKTRPYKPLMTINQLFLVTPSRSAGPEHRSQSQSLCVDEICSPQSLDVFAIWFINFFHSMMNLTYKLAGDSWSQLAKTWNKIEIEYNRSLQLLKRKPTKTKVEKKKSPAPFSVRCITKFRIHFCLFIWQATCRVFFCFFF